MFGPGSLHGDLETGMLRSFLQGTLGYVGLSVHQPFVAYHVPYVSDDARRQMVADLGDTIRTLDARPLMPMPDLATFDDTFAPLAEGRSPPGSVGG